MEKSNINVLVVKQFFLLFKIDENVHVDIMLLKMYIDDEKIKYNQSKIILDKFQINIQNNQKSIGFKCMFSKIPKITNALESIFSLKLISQLFLQNSSVNVDLILSTAIKITNNNQITVDTLTDKVELILYKIVLLEQTKQTHKSKVKRLREREQRFLKKNNIINPDGDKPITTRGIESWLTKI